MSKIRVIISLIAVGSIIIALYGVWQWNYVRSNQPTRESEQIRS